MTADAALAEVRRLGGTLAEPLIEDARRGDIRTDDLLRWVRSWHTAKLAGRGRCRRCGERINCPILVSICLACARLS